ncbi:GAF domain-containing protein [Geomonas sp. RF6]|uniref:MASE3 domain-containing protein n=1 Tax=Geomonas sp. RF6 TaxID=2897342 RepID=UPI001E526E46|nr:MASE3 domain-containing protein [Geomonas sp. RF6]UFS71468.1 GAF domain-containing protein [Geomonas sp. RF6]
MSAPQERLQQLSPRAQVTATFVACLLPFLMVQLLPSQLDRVMEKSSYLVFHNIAEFFSIMVSLCVFSVGWYTYDQSKDQRSLLLGGAFLLVGLLDFMHTLSNAAMPPFITANSTNKSTQFWIAARGVDASVFLLSAFVNPKKPIRSVSCSTVITAALALAGIIFTAVIFYPEYLPATAIPGVGLTPLKRYLELMIIAVLCAASVMYWKRLCNTGDRNILYFLNALIICIFSEGVFASYKTGFDTYNVLGHIYKVVAFYLIYKGIFAAAVRKPYLDLSRANEKLMRLNRLYTVLSETNKCIVRATERDALFRDVTEVAVRHGGLRTAWIGVVDENAGEVTVVAWSGEKEGHVEGAAPVRDATHGAGPTAIAIREGGLRICSDSMSKDAPEPWRKEAQRCGFGSSAAIALTVHGKVIGALTMHAAERDFFHSQLANLLSQMATEITFALENMEVEARRREAEKALQEETLERLRVMESLYQKDRQLIHQSRLAAMGEMINNIAHQWRQPLNVVGLIVQELQMMHEAGECSQEFLDKRVEKLKELLFHMSQTIDDFRDFFRPDRDKERFQVKGVVTRTLSLIRDSLMNQRVEVEVEISDSMVIYGYANQYAQVLLNILMNARDAFAERDDIKRRVITIAAGSDGETDRLVVTDNAGGVPEEIIHKIFEPYFTTKGPDKGTGVGLYMSKLIIDHNMSGHLTARNTADGAEFIVEIPCAPSGGAEASSAAP